MTNVIGACFFNQPVSDCLQHIALILEITAIGLVWRDYRIFQSDVAKTGRMASLTSMPGPRKRRHIELAVAFTTGGIAVILETY